MRKLIIAVAVLGIAGPAYAQGGWDTNTFGDQSFSTGTGSNQGWRSESNTFGDSTFTDTYGPRGQHQSCTTERFGDQDFTNCQ